MKKDLGVKPYLFPMPVLMIVTYDDGKVDEMNMAWGGICAEHMVSLNIDADHRMDDKFEHSGLTAVKSEKVDAPVVQEFLLTLECKVVEDKEKVYGHHVIGEIVGVLADEAVLDEKGKVDPTKLNAFVFDQFQSGYYAIGEKVGQAWHTGAPLMKK